MLLGSDPFDGNSTPAAPNPIWVDFGFTGGLEAGTLSNPFGTLEAAVSAAGSGATIRVKGDVTTTVGAWPSEGISKPLTIDAFRGSVRLQ